jgi:amino acid transporter
MLFFASLLTHNRVLIALIDLSLALATLAVFFVALVSVSRNLFAWAFDRILPAKVAEVNERTHSPLIANLIIFVVLIGFLAVIVYGPTPFFTLAYTSIIGQLFTFLAVAFAGMIFPWRRPDLYETSPLAQRRFLGLPTISVLGFLSIGVYLLFLVSLWRNAALGANSHVGLVAVGIAIAVAFPLYGLSYYLNKKRGVDIRLSYLTLPPE